MRIEFDDSVPHDTALGIAKRRKQPGRKHLHQPRGRAREKLHRKLQTAQIHRNAMRGRHNAKVRAYWAGERDTHP